MGTLENNFGNNGNSKSQDDKVRDAGRNPDTSLNDALKMPDFSKLDLKDVEAAAAAGNLVAQNELGDRYYDGTGVPKNLKIAVEWWTKAAEQGDVDARGKIFAVNLMTHNREAYLRATLEICLPRAQTGDANAQYNVAVCIQELTKNPAHPTALECLVKSAAQGYAPAQDSLGQCYSKGHGVGRDPNMAFRLFEAAANQGYGPAECNLGHCYGQGSGVELDYTRAAELFKRAADKGVAQAQFYLGGCYRYGQGVPQDNQLSAAWMEKAAQQGHAEAMSCLGMYYMAGLGVDRDESKGLELLTVAAQRGDLSARLVLFARDAATASGQSA